MSTSVGGWDTLRQLFADQFESVDGKWVYRRSQNGPAFVVSEHEREKFVTDFDRHLGRAIWIIYAGIILVIGGTVAVSLLMDDTFLEPGLYGGIAVVMAAYFAFYHWAWSRPSHALVRRAPVAGRRPKDEVRRRNLERLSYGQLALAAAGALVLPFLGIGSQDWLSGWNWLWLLFAGAIFLILCVQAVRKWRFDRSNSADPLSMGSIVRTELTNTDEGADVPVSGRKWRYLPTILFFGVLGFVAFTPAGKRLAQEPGFWPAVMICFGAWAGFSVARGLHTGRIEPLMRGFHNEYDRSTQPKRFWASILWNGVFASLCLILAHQMYKERMEEPLEKACHSYRGDTAERIAACAELIRLRPRDADAHLYKGLAHLSNWSLDPAIADLTRAHELEPSSAWPLANRGLAYAWKNDRARASRDFEAAKAIDPDNYVVLHGEATLSMFAGELEVAIAQLTLALKRNPQDLWALQTRADVYQQAGEFDKARADREALQRLARRQ